MTVPRPEPGDRIMAVRFETKQVPPGGSIDEQGLIRDPDGNVLTVDDNVTVPAGTLGTVDSIDDVGTLHVEWDNGRRLGLLPDRDEWVPA